MNIQPFTYDRIKTNSWINGSSLAIPHGIGHAWAATLWDMTWNLIDRHGFNPNVYEGWESGGNNLALQLVTDGLKFQGCGPGFVVGRDAIIAADQALTGGENACILWSSFPRRGLGFSAVQGTTGRDDNTEAFDVPPTCTAPGGGFVGGVANPPALNVVKAGAHKPMVFSLSGTRALTSWPATRRRRRRSTAPPSPRCNSLSRRRPRPRARPGYGTTRWKTGIRTPGGTRRTGLGPAASSS
jgi:extracellular elastinolytic metalloproteinase